MRAKNAKKGDLLLGAASFLLPALISLWAFARMGAFPFGDKSLLVADMSSEYIDYFMYLGQMLREGGNVQRSWSMGMGLNLLGLIAFYMGSPLNLIPFLSPPELLTEAVFLLTILKLGLCGLTFHLYARRFPHLHPALSLALSTAYALSGYNIAYSSNIMWLDGVACLPLLLLGVEHLLEAPTLKSKYGLYLFSLIWLFLSSYYIGYMAGLFAFLYFTVRFFSVSSDWREYGKRLCSFLGGALLAAGLCAFLLLPAFLNLKNGQEGMWDVPLSPALTASPFRLVSKLLPGVFDSITDSGMPNLYCTVPGLFCHLLFYLHRRISRREKLLWGGFELLLLLSLSVDFLNLAWHAFEDPTWYPARYSFVFVFLILSLALRAFSAGTPSPFSLLAALAGTSLLFAGIVLWGVPQAGFAPFAAGFSSALLCAVLLLPSDKRPSLRSVFSWLLLLLVTFESGWNAHATISGVDDQLSYRTRNSYYLHRQDLSEALSILPQGEEYRAETTYMRNANAALALGYRSVSHYSTTTDQRLNELLRAFGYNTGTINELRYSPSTPLADGFLGIRYLMAELPPGAGWSLVSQGEPLSVFENAYAFPLAFYADHIPGPPADRDDPFALQNHLLTQLWEGIEARPFVPIRSGDRVEKGLIPTSPVGYEAWIRDNNTANPQVSWQLTWRPGRPAYAYFPTALSRRFSRATASVNEEEPRRILAYRNNPMLFLGFEGRGGVEIRVESSTLRMNNACFYSIDPSAAKLLADTARSNAASFSVFEATRLVGEAVAPRDGALLTTFPWDKGWSAWVDGIKTETQPFAGVFLALPLTEGSHTLELRYRAPGLLPGVVISVLSAALLLALCRRGRRQN